jgi:hypothetical protein
MTAHLRAKDREIAARGVKVREDSVFRSAVAGLAHVEKVDHADLRRCSGMTPEPQSANGGSLPALRDPVYRSRC